jgi:ketosteroid isomerase-like protein
MKNCNTIFFLCAITAASALSGGCATTDSSERIAVSASSPSSVGSQLKQDVMNTERAFARSMAERDHAAFSRFLADDVVFFGRKVLRGRAEVAEGWRRFYSAAEAPFSWEPAEVEVLESGALALSSGPVRNTRGELIATFTSIWRREPSGQWRIVFDKGNDACEKCAK